MLWVDEKVYLMYLLSKYLNLKFSIEEDTEWSAIVIMFVIEKSEVKSLI